MEIIDTYANAWRLVAGRLRVRPEGTDDWEDAPGDVPADAQGWAFVLADHAGFVWRGRDDGLQRLDPHAPQAGWHPVPAQALAAAAGAGTAAVTLTALAGSPQDLAMAGLSTGHVLEVDVDADGGLCPRRLGRADGAVHQLQTGDDGSITAQGDAGTLRIPAAADAWQQHWRRLARLPGGNHDLFAIEHEHRLWMAGGLTSGRGLPARTHVFDELFAYDPAADRWEVVSRMPFPRCYSGIARLEGAFWIVGGAANLAAPEDPDGAREPLADVQVYDPAAGSWRAGPPLAHRRLEPIVVSAAGSIWCIGGTGGEPLAVVESIGPGERSWRAEAPAPHPIHQADACVLDDVVYVMSRAGFAAFDAARGSWDTDLPQLASSPQAAQVAVHGGQVWVMGGSRRRDTHVYDPRARTWRAGPDLPCDNSWGAAVDVGGTLIVAGGAHRSERHRTYVFDDRLWALRQG